MPSDLPPRHDRTLLDRTMARRSVLRGALGLGVSLLAAPARACEFDAGGYTIVHPWAVAAPPDATATALCMRFTNVVERDRLVGVITPLAPRAELGGAPPGTPLSIDIVPGAELSLAQDGPHVRLLDLKYPVLMGRQFPLSLVFERLGTFPVTMYVDYAFR